MYLNVLDRPGEAAGVAFWTRVLDEGLADRGHIAFEFSESGEHIVQMNGPQGTAPDYVPPVNPLPLPPSRLYGGSGADTIQGTAGPDGIWGFLGDDVLYGGDGNDQLYGYPGRDTIFGGAGDDYIVGGADGDMMYGGPGNDLFVTALPIHGDSFPDSEPGDHILVQGTAGHSLTTVWTGTDGMLAFDVLVHGRGENTMTFQGLTAADEGWVRDAIMLA